MKLRVYSLYSKIISLFLIALGFSSCSDDDPVVEYGSPWARYKVSGKVISEGTKEPVKNIRVVMVQDVFNESEYPHLMGDTVFTNNDGNFEITNRYDYQPSLHGKYKIKLQDVDNDENGLFEDKQQVIEFKDSDYIGGSKWYEGEALKDMGTIELIPKQPE